MKPWMKALVWLGMGLGIGGFAGYQLGYFQNKKDVMNNATEMADKMTHEVYEEHKKVMELEEKLRTADQQLHDTKVQAQAAIDAIRSYKGMDGDTDGDEELMTTPPEMPDDPLEEVPTVVEDNEPGDFPEPDEHIAQLHPEDIRPFEITGADWAENEKEYDQVELDYYSEDGVIFDPRREEKWTHPEQLLGIGWRYRFATAGGKPGARQIYIQNDTMETLYKVTRIDDSFTRLYEEE